MTGPGEVGEGLLRLCCSFTQIAGLYTHRSDNNKCCNLKVNQYTASVQADKSSVQLPIAWSSLATGGPQSAGWYPCPVADVWLLQQARLQL